MSRIGVLSLQGDVSEHLNQTRRALSELGLRGEVSEVNTKEEVSGSDALIIPGGESTTIGKLLRKYAIGEEIKKLAREGKPIMGTCAGLIMLGRDTNEVGSLGLLDMDVSRNAFGRQKESFEADLEIKDIGGYHAVFIRAPAIERLGKDMRAMAEYKGKVVAAEKDNLLVLAFHPELTDDTRIHQYFLKKLR